MSSKEEARRMAIATSKPLKKAKEPEESTFEYIPMEDETNKLAEAKRVRELMKPASRFSKSKKKYNAEEALEKAEASRVAYEATYGKPFFLPKGAPPAPLPPFAPPPLEMVVGPPPAPVLTKAEQWAKLPSMSAEVRAKIISDRAKDPEYQARMAYQRQREGKATAKDLEIIAKFEAYLKSSTVRR
jgi:hypothetical protein